MNEITPQQVKALGSLGPTAADLINLYERRGSHNTLSAAIITAVEAAKLALMTGHVGARDGHQIFLAWTAMNWQNENESARTA